MAVVEAVLAEVNAPRRDSDGINDPVLQVAVQRANKEQLPFAGAISPQDAWRLHAEKKVVLIDVRTLEERKFVGYVPGSLVVSWQVGASLVSNPRFVKETEKQAQKSDVILLLCRSGKRSASAAEVLTKNGFKYVFNILEGFEGDIDERQHRGSFNGWKFHNLPWIQE